MKRDQFSECNGCGSPERFILHNLRQRASYRRLCTNCVLKNHPSHFCPVCLEVFNEPPSPHQRLICLKCPSISHLSCSSSNSLSQSFTCPPCSNPSFNFFNLVPDKKPDHPPPPGSTKNDDVSETRVIDKEAAKALIAAAKLASISMTKAASVARMEAERKVKEATLAKKRAKEALERVALLVRKENDRIKSSGSPLGVPKSKADANVKGNNGSFSVSGANVSIPKLLHQQSTHGWSWKKILKLRPMVQAIGGFDNHYHSSQICDKLRDHKGIVSWYHIVWGKHTIPRHSFIAWLVILNIVSTKSRLAKWGRIEGTNCIMCNEGIEDRDHLFSSCELSTCLWNNILSICGRSTNNHQWDHMLSWVMHNGKGNSFNAMVIRIAWTAYIYCIWQERNSRLHGGPNRNHVSIFSHIKIYCM